MLLELCQRKWLRQLLSLAKTVKQQKQRLSCLVSNLRKGGAYLFFEYNELYMHHHHPDDESKYRL